MRRITIYWMDLADDKENITTEDIVEIAQTSWNTAIQIRS